MRLFQFLVIFLTLTPLLFGQGKPGWLSSEVSPAKTAEWLSHSDSSRVAPAISFVSPVSVTDREAASSLANHTSQSSALITPQLTSTNLTTPGGNEADFVTPEIEALARGLRNDPVKIFEYVHNYIKFEAYYGSKKGAHLTLLEASGNEHDQCSLLVALLRAAGLSPSYKFGPCIFVYSQLADWFGLSTSPFSHWSDAQLSAYYFPTGGAPAGFPSASYRQRLSIYEFLTSKGYPYVDAFVSSSTGTLFLSIPHVWVELYGKKLSPALKYQTLQTGIDLVAATGYSRSQILGDAAGTVNSDGGDRWVSGLNYQGLTTRLTNYTQSFIQAVKSTADSLPSEKVTKSSSIDKQIFTSLDDTPEIFPDSYGASQWMPFETWSAIPVGHMSKLEIRAGVWDASAAAWSTLQYLETINLPSLRGRKLSLTQEAGGAILRLDEAPLGNLIALPASQTSIDMELTVTHNHYEITKTGGTYSTKKYGKTNQKENKNYNIDGNSAYAIVYCFSNPDGVLRARQEQLDAYQRAGLTDSDWRVKTETLNIMGLNWFYQRYQAEMVTAGLYDMVLVNHHQFGRVGQEPSLTTNQQTFYIDVGLMFSASSHRTMNFAEELNFSNFSSTLASAMEHGVLEQMQGADVAATSTVKMVYLANQAGQRIYRANNTNWSSVAAELQSYPASRLTSIGNALAASSYSRALIPRSGQMIYNQYKGFGYALEEPTRISMLIGANFGGFSSKPVLLTSAPVINSNRSNPAYPASSTLLPISNVPRNLPQATFNDPVDVLSGAFVLDAMDLSLGGAAPDGLTFSRSYNSNSRYNSASGLGYGWTHSYDITATQRSSVKAGLGATHPYQAAPFFTALTVASDLARGHTTAKEWATAALVLHWAVDQLKYKAVTISQGSQAYEFVEMPDGSYMSPAGSKHTLVKNAAGNFELTQRHGATLFFRADGKLDHITDLFGKTQQFTYNINRQLTQVTDAYNRAINFTWAGDKITALTDSTSRTVGFNYTGNDLTTVTDVEGKTMTYLYDAEHRISQIKDALNRTTIENDYDTKSRVISQRNQGDPSKFYQIFYTGYANTEVDPTGGSTTHLYDERGRVIGSKDALGNADTTLYDGQDRKIRYFSPKLEITDWYYDSDHNVTAESDPKHLYTNYFYDSLLRLQRVLDKRGAETLFSYNSNHQVLTLTDPLLHVTTNQYLPNGLLSNTTDAEGKITTFAYDTLGQVNRVTYPDGKFKTQVNHPRGDVLTATDPENRTVTNTYNLRRQPLTTTLPTIVGEPAATTSQTYDDAGNPLTSTDAKGQITSHDYNSLANHLTTTLPALAAGNNVVTSTYDSRDWLTNTSNSLGLTVTSEYDAAHRLTAVTDPLNRRTESVYDANGRVTQTKDALDRITQQNWSSRGEKDRGTDALTKNTDYTYDNIGNLTGLTNRRGKFYQFTFDAANRPTSSTTPGGNVSFTTYWNNNQVKTLQEPSNQTTTLAYNGKNLVSSKSDPTGTISYGYNHAGDLLTVTEGATTLTRTYDGRGRLKTFTTADGDLIQYLYDANNNLTRLTYPDGKQVNYTYNSRNLLATVTDWSNRVTSYNYDCLGRLTGTTRPNGTSNQIAHDAASQLTSVKEYSGTKLISYLAFKYDAAGQIQSRFRAPLVNSGWQHPALTAAYDDDNRLLTANGVNVTHDADGNMTRSVGILPTSPNTAVDLTYNSRNQLTYAAGVSYTYDAEGRRRTFTDAAGTTRDAIDPSGKLLVRTHPNNTKTYYVYGLGLLYEASQANTTKTYHFDQVGSTLARTDDSGKVIGQAEYSAYGLTIWKQGDMATPFLYNGQAGVQTDPNGLLNMRARYYSPYLMRFLNADPSGFSGGPNWFAYADGNPISKSDPFGLCAQGGGGVWNTLKAVGTAQYNNLSSGAGFLMDGVANAALSVPQGMAWATDQAHHVLNGSWSNLGSSGINAGMINAMEAAKNPYGNQGYYDPGIASDVRDAAIGAAAIVYGGGTRGGGAAANGEGTVIGRVKDLQNLGAGEKSLLDQLPDLGSPKANWHQNSGVLRQEMNRGLPIRDASVGDTGGQFLNAERNLLQDRGWTFDGSYWNP
jgi:RHS repeat-associated protein